MRSTFSRTVPRRLWKTMPPSFSSARSSGAFWSSCQKKRASERRARMTRSVPFAMRSGRFAVLTTAR